MSCRLGAVALFLLALVHPATAAQVTLVVDDADGSAGRAQSPVSVQIDVKKLQDAKLKSDRLVLVETTANATPVPVQCEPCACSSGKATLRWLMPPGKKGQRRFRLTSAEQPAAALGIQLDKKLGRIDVTEGKRPVLRYNHGMVPVREGTHAHPAKGGTYERADYISPLFGLDGEELTEDYPRDHPHHRGVWWSWPVTRWNDQVTDIWAVRGVRAHPVSIKSFAAGPVAATIQAESVWKWADKDPIVNEKVLIRAYRQAGDCRVVDVDVRLTALVDGVAIGGRPKRGYGGFALRAAPCTERKTTLHTDPAEAKPRRSWLDYSGVYAGGKGTSGTTIFEHVSNPDYPNPLHEYLGCNCVMPAFPAAREVPLPKGKTLLLKHRLLIHRGGNDQTKAGDVWNAYEDPPKVSIAK